MSAEQEAATGRTDPAESQAVLTPRRGAAVGLAGVVGLASVFAATVVTPGFSWTGNALSDLGVMEFAGLFNGALVAAGACLTVFAWTLRDAPGTPDRASARAGTWLLAVGGVFLVLVGIVTEHFGVWHTVVSLGWFILPSVGVLTLGVAFLAEEGLPGASGSSSMLTRRGVGSIVAGTVGLVVGPGFILGIAVGGRAVGIAIPEYVQALVLAAWVVWMAAPMLASRS